MSATVHSSVARTFALWFRGAVPPRFKERLQNNAHFLRPGRTEVPVMVLP